MIENRERESTIIQDEGKDMPSPNPPITGTNGKQTSSQNGRQTPELSGRQNPGLGGPRLQARGGKSVQTSVLLVILI